MFGQNQRASLGTGIEDRSWRTRARMWLNSSDEDGQSLVEFALCLPPLLLIVTGISAFALTLNNYLILTDATNVGARQLSISRGQTLDPCATVASAVYAAAPTLTKSKLTFSFTLNSVPITSAMGLVAGGASCPSASTTTGAAGDLVQGAPAMVTVAYPCTLVLYKQTMACALQTQTTELVQ
jgi:Flp pilus assembly protein TadG